MTAQTPPFEPRAISPDVAEYFSQLDSRTNGCDHAEGDSCIHCCLLCDTARHVCPGCGANVSHGTIACARCNAKPQTSPLAEPAPATVDLDDTAASWYAALRHADEQIAQFTGIRGRAIEHLQSAMGDATEARIGGIPAISWKPSRPGMRLDRSALEAHYGAEAIAVFLKPSAPSRPFKVIPQDGA